jgi:hypothetical protein
MARLVLAMPAAMNAASPAAFTVTSMTTLTSPLLPDTPDRDREADTGRYLRQRVALRYWLQGAGMYDALRAMNFAEGHHQGVRKDGVTPEFSHQVSIASHLRTLVPHLLHPQETITTAFLHDVREDYDVPDSVIRAAFGPVVADAVDAMTKEFNGVRRPEAEVFAAIAANPVSSIAKLADRIHNLDSMIGVFTAAKAAGYVAETQQWFLPMLREARRAFPSQEPAYENAKVVLSTQLKLISALASAA